MRKEKEDLLTLKSWLNLHPVSGERIGNGYPLQPGSAFLATVACPVAIREKKKRNNLGICSSELVKTVEAVERLLSDQTALCVLLISWAVLGCISRSFFTGFRSEFRGLAFRKRSKLKNVHCFKAKDIKLQLKARNQHFVPSF